MADLFTKDRSADEAAVEASAILDDVIERNNPSHVFALFSGGHDSLCSVHLASKHPRFSGAVHVNTEIGIERTREFVRETCCSYGWPLIELRPPRPPFQDKQGRPWGEFGQTAYEALVLRWGFPGPKGHTLMYNRLKERCIARLIREHRQKKQRIVLVTGVRRQESRRRMGHIVSEQREGRRVWCAPLVDWNEDDKRAYRLANQLPTNKVAKRLCMSGECLCGAFARPEELAEVEKVCPATATYIRSLELRVKDAGQSRCRWGEKNDLAVDLAAARRKANRADQPWLPLCHGCEGRWDEGGAA